MLLERKADGCVFRRTPSRHLGRGGDGVALAEADVDKDGDGAAVLLDDRTFGRLDRVGELERRSVTSPLLGAGVEVGGRAVR